MFFPSELHSVHPPVHLRPADLDGQPLHLCVRLLQRRHHRQVLQTVCPAEGAGAGGARKKTPVHTHIHTHTCMHTQTHRHTHMHTHPPTHTHTHTHTHEHTHTHTHTNTHTHTDIHTYRERCAFTEAS